MTVDGTDALKVHDAVRKAADRARAGKGPSLVESKFYRLSAHGNVITVPPLPTQFPEHEAIGVYGNRAEFETCEGQRPAPEIPRPSDEGTGCCQKPKPKALRTLPEPNWTTP